MKNQPREPWIRLLRFCAIFTSACILLSESILLGVETQPVSAAETIAVPENIGTVEEVYSASKKTIIYIQDAHDSLEAQENIAKIIHHLVKESGIKTVLEEGYEGPVPTDEYFNFIEDPEVKKKVAFFLLDKLRLGGAEYAHINRQEDFELIGVDSEELHKGNIEAYQEAAKVQESIETDLKAIEKHIKKLANRFFPKKLKEWIKLKKRLNEDNIQLLDYVRRLHKEHPATDYPNITLIIESGDSKDPKVIEKLKAVNAKALFKEIENYELAYANHFIESERDKQIFEYYRVMQLLKRLNRIELTAEEYDIVKQSLKGLDTQKLAEFIVEHSGKSIVLSKRWERQIKSAMHFYDTAHTRDELLENKLKEHFKERDIAILVFGGFHKNKLKEILKRNQFSYTIVTPKISEISEKHQKYYKRLMSVGYHPEELSQTN